MGVPSEVHWAHRPSAAGASWALLGQHPCKCSQRKWQRDRRNPRVGFPLDSSKKILRESQREPSLDGGPEPSWRSPRVPETHPLAPGLGDRPRPGPPRGPDQVGRGDRGLQEASPPRPARTPLFLAASWAPRVAEVGAEAWRLRWAVRGPQAGPGGAQASCQGRGRGGIREGSAESRRIQTGQAWPRGGEPESTWEVPYPSSSSSPFGQCPSRGGGGPPSCHPFSRNTPPPPQAGSSMPDSSHCLEPPKPRVKPADPGLRGRPPHAVNA